LKVRKVLRFGRLPTGGTKMANQLDRQTDAKIENQSRTDAAINYSDEPRPAAHSPTNTLRFMDDDLIVFLANAHENRRARQVTKWEKMRQTNLPLSA